MHSKVGADGYRRPVHGVADLFATVRALATLVLAMRDDLASRRNVLDVLRVERVDRINVMASAEKIASRFAGLLKAKRLEKGYSHEVLAEKAGLNRSTISLYESEQRNPTLASALRLSEALGTPLSDILYTERSGTRLTLLLLIFDIHPAFDFSSFS